MKYLAITALAASMLALTSTSMAATSSGEEIFIEPVKPAAAPAKKATKAKSKSKTTKKKKRKAKSKRRHCVGRKIVFNHRTHRWYAYRNCKLIRSGKGSGGASYCADVKRACRTPRGTFRIISKRGAGCRSSRYPRGRGGAPMPYCMFFHRLYAIHGSYNVPAKRHASHGCIRVVPSAAKWLNRNFLRIGDLVVIK